MSHNYLIAINKPMSWTSSDVVIKSRNILSAALNEKIKIGHMGTLDPIASGVLLLGINKATRLFDYLLSKDKEYIGDVTFGTSTDTLDSTGNITSTSSLPNIDELKKIIPSFLGEIEQIPPKYSALKINGKKAYDLAREGKDFEIASRKVNIYDIQLLDYKSTIDGVSEAKIKVNCSSGTYIRTLFSDIAKKLNVDGHMSALTRTKLANVSLDTTITIEELIKAPLDHFINPLDVIKNLMDVYEMTDSEYVDIKNGKTIKIDKEVNILALKYKGELKFIAKYKFGLYKAVTNLE